LTGSRTGLLKAQDLFYLLLQQLSQLNSLVATSNSSSYILSPLLVRDYTTTLSVNVGGQVVDYNGLDILYMMRTKLHHCIDRVLPRDFDDIEFLLTKYAPQVSAIANQLTGDSKGFFLNHDRITSKGTALQARYRAILGL
jgi:hypothetical protein